MLKILKSAIKYCTYTTGTHHILRNVARKLSSKKKTDFEQQLNFYSEFILPDQLCFDVGANVGLKSEIFLNLGAKVIAFEPQTDLFLQFAEIQKI